MCLVEVRGNIARRDDGRLIVERNKAIAQMIDVKVLRADLDAIVHLCVILLPCG